MEFLRDRGPPKGELGGLVERGIGGSGWLVGGFALGGLVVVGWLVLERCRGTEVNGTTPQRLVSVGLPTLALTCISTDTVLTYP